MEELAEAMAVRMWGSPKVAYPLLARRTRVGPNRAPERLLREQYERGTGGFRVELVSERDGGEILTIPDESSTLRVELGFNSGSTILGATTFNWDSSV